MSPAACGSRRRSSGHGICRSREVPDGEAVLLSVEVRPDHRLVREESGAGVRHPLVVGGERVGGAERLPGDEVRVLVVDDGGVGAVGAGGAAVEAELPSSVGHEEGVAVVLQVDVGLEGMVDRGEPRIERLHEVVRAVHRQERVHLGGARLGGSRVQDQVDAVPRRRRPRGGQVGPGGVPHHAEGPGEGRRHRHRPASRRLQLELPAGSGEGRARAGRHPEGGEGALLRRVPGRIGEEAGRREPADRAGDRGVRHPVPRPEDGPRRPSPARLAGRVHQDDRLPRRAGALAAHLPGETGDETRSARDGHDHQPGGDAAREPAASARGGRRARRRDGRVAPERGIEGEAGEEAGREDVAADQDDLRPGRDPQLDARAQDRDAAVDLEVAELPEGSQVHRRLPLEALRVEGEEVGRPREEGARRRLDRPGVAGRGPLRRREGDRAPVNAVGRGRPAVPVDPPGPGMLREEPPPRAPPGERRPQGPRGAEGGGGSGGAGILARPSRGEEGSDAARAAAHGSRRRLDSLSRSDPMEATIVAHGLAARGVRRPSRSTVDCPLSTPFLSTPIPNAHPVPRCARLPSWFNGGPGRPWPGPAGGGRPGSWRGPWVRASTTSPSPSSPAHPPGDRW